MIFHTPSCYVLFFGGKKSTKRTLSIYHFPLNDFAKSRAVVAAASRGASACAARQAAIRPDSAGSRSFYGSLKASATLSNSIYNPTDLSLGNYRGNDFDSDFDPDPDFDSDLDG